MDLEGGDVVCLGIKSDLVNSLMHLVYFVLCCCR